MRSNEHAIQCQWQKVVPYVMISKDTAQQHNILSILSFISLVNNSFSKTAYQVPNSPTPGSNHRTHISTWISEHFLPDSSDQPQLLSYLLNA